jgi:hypothetical protein
MTERRETRLVATGAILCGVVFGIALLACGQHEDEPDVKTETPATEKAEPDSPPASSSSKTERRPKVTFSDMQSHVQDLGVQLEAFRNKATGDLAAGFGEMEAKQAQLTTELEEIGGDNEKWESARKEILGEIRELRNQIRDFAAKLNG